MLGVQSVLNVLTALTAIDYNKNRFYSKTGIKLIQKHINTPQTGVWDIQSCTAVYDWQRSVMRLRPLKGDGMFGPTSLGILIEELVIQGHKKDAEYLRQFWHKDKHGNIVKKDIVESEKIVYAFFHSKGKPLEMRKDPNNVGRWMMKGSFNVEVYMDRQLPDPTRYEYRQFIKGRIYVHDGYFGDAAQTVWQARSGTTEVEQNDYSRVPGGLNRQYFTEDGEKLSDGSVEKFGYRSKPPKWEEGIIDTYTNDQKGYEYRLQDTFGIEGPRKTDAQGNFKAGLKVGVDLWYRGIVIKDGRMPTFQEINASNWRSYCVASHDWRYTGVAYVKW
jgi:hypothetical protein